ncbi:MAG: polyamine aminopropyltransferase [Betaproteobacteria bacterium]|nr:polyamine aminopropyltransferase [Betaproteobacteria bacterium]
MKFFARWLRGLASGPDEVYVTERSGVRSLHIGSDTIQSSMRLARPNDLELAYTRSMMAFLLFHEEPQRALVVGLGGGSVVKFIYHRMPWMKIEVVEVNPQVVAVARQQFNLPAAGERVAMHICDGAEYMARAGPAADVILVDGYDGDSQVNQLSSRAFYGACLRRLAARGVLVVNLWGSDRGFNDNLARIEAAFPAGTLCLPAARPGNVIVLAFRDPPGSLGWAGLEPKARELEERYGLEFLKFVQGLRKMNRCDGERLYVA